MNTKKFDFKSLFKGFDTISFKKNTFNIFLILSIFAYFMIFIFGSVPLIKYIISYLEKINMFNGIGEKTLLNFTLKTFLLYAFGFALPYYIYSFIFKYKPNIFKIKCNLKNEDKNKDENKTAKDSNIRTKTKIKALLNNILISILLGFTLQPVGMGISALSTLITGSNTASNAISKLDLNGNLFLTSIIIAICPAIFEELIYRGIIFDSLKKCFNLKIAAILSGILFGLMHMNVQQFFYAAFLGTFFVFIYNKTKNIFDTMIIHFVINFTQFLLSFLLFKSIGEDIQNTAPITQDTNMIISTLILSAILIIPFYKICIKLYNKYKTI